jgi:hypothetical protein
MGNCGSVDMARNLILTTETIAGILRGSFDAHSHFCVSSYSIAATSKGVEHSVKPILQALVVAERIWEERSGKKIIGGTFNRYKFSRKPPSANVQKPDGTTQQVLVGGMQVGSPYAYVSLTDVCEGTKLLLQFINMTKNLVLFGTEAVVTNIDRLTTLELVFPLPQLPISEAGTYALEVICEGDILGSWRVVAEDLDQKQEETKNDDNV